jgi:salicylate hydroxylase
MHTYPSTNTNLFKHPTYPTRSLNFLKHVKTAKTPTPSTEVAQSPVRLHVVIVGAGLGGLATAIALARGGHKVEILEQAPALGEVELPPPSTNSRVTEADRSNR